MGVKGKKAVRPWYKLTDMGLIPEEWNMKDFDWVFCRINAKEFQIQTSEYQASGRFPVIDQWQSRIVGYSDRKGGAFRCPEDGVVVFWDHTCVIKFIDFDFVIGADWTQILWAKQGCNARFLAYCLEMNGITSTWYNRHFKFLKERQFCTPGIQEQSAIAQVLSDTDALIASLDALIGKKRAIKQGAMQELLTGKRRLPGFKNALRRFKIGEIGFCFWGLVGKSKADFGKWNAKYIPFLNVMKNPVIDLTFLENVSIGSGEKQNVVRKDDLIFNWSSETPEEVGLCSVVRWEIWELYLNSFCFGFRAWNSRMIEWLYISYFFRSEQGRRMMSVLAQGATRYNLSKSAFLDSEICLPNFDEQSAISSVLSDMDAEIATIEAKRDKYKAIKQGMMQELLTGNIRLVWAK